MHVQTIIHVLSTARDHQTGLKSGIEAGFICGSMIECITMFELLYRTSIEGTAHLHEHLRWGYESHPENTALQMWQCNWNMCQYIWDCQMWQSWVEIEHYSVAYFGRITTFIATALAQTNIIVLLSDCVFPKCAMTEISNTGFIRWCIPGIFLPTVDPVM